MSITKKAALSGIWLAGARFLSQIFSWVVTVTIARILVPGDYGLMAMAVILAGYIELFSEMGFSMAVIQKKEISQKELSSVFWFSMITSFILAVIIFILAYPTAWIFDEPRVVRITQLYSFVFVINALMIVPYGILSREIRFKEIGINQLISTIISSAAMFWMAHIGFGVWTLINGIIISRASSVLLTYVAARWKPSFHFNIDEIRSLLRFGMTIVGARSLFYLFQKSDQFIVGKMFNATYLGYYSFAMELASIPTDKIMSIIQQVSFPVFSKYQTDQIQIQNMYLKTVQYVAYITAPLFLAGAFLGEEIILVLLGAKWTPIIILFSFFCILQFIVSLTMFNNIVHIAQGRPRWSILFTLSNLLIMPTALTIAGNQGFTWLPIPWLTIYPILCICYIWATLRKLSIPIGAYMASLAPPFLAAGSMIIGVLILKYLSTTMHIVAPNSAILLAQEIISGAILYMSYLIIFEKKILVELWNIRKG